MTPCGWRLFKTRRNGKMFHDLKFSSNVSPDFVLYFFLLRRHYKWKENIMKSKCCLLYIFTCFKQIFETKPWNFFLSILFLKTPQVSIFLFENDKQIKKSSTQLFEGGSLMCVLLEKISRKIPFLVDKTTLIFSQKKHTRNVWKKEAICQYDPLSLWSKTNNIGENSE